MLSGGKAERPTLHGNPLPIAVGVRPRNGRTLQVEVNIVRNKQIEAPAAVVVQKTTSRAPARRVTRKAGGLGHIAEGTVTVVAVELVVSEVGAKNILETVVIIVPNTDPGSPADGVEARLFSHVGESAVTTVLVEA